MTPHAHTSHLSSESAPSVELPASDGNVLGQDPQTRSINVQIVSVSGFAKRVRFLLLLLSLSLPPPSLKKR